MADGFMLITILHGLLMKPDVFGTYAGADIQNNKLTLLHWPPGRYSIKFMYVFSFTFLRQ